MPESNENRPLPGSGPEDDENKHQSNSSLPDLKLPPVVTRAEVGYSPEFLFGGDVARKEVPTVDTLPFLGRIGYIAAGQSTLIASYPKAGKTTLLAALIPEWVLSGNRVLVLTEEPLLAWCVRVPARDAELWDRVRLISALDQFPASLIEHTKD